MSAKSQLLIGPSTWSDFIHVIRAKAQLLDVWHLIDPKIDQEPTLLSRPTPPPDTTGEDISVEKHTIADIKLRRYHAMLNDYKEQRASLSTVMDLILNTIAKKNLLYIRQVEQKPWAVLRALQSKLKPTDAAQTLDIATRYRKCCKPPTNQNMEQWVEEFYNVYSLAKELDMNESKGYRPALDFLDALGSVDSKFAEAYTLTLSDPDLTTALDVETVIERYRHHIRVTKPRANRKLTDSSHSAFAATFKEKQPPSVDKKSGKPERRFPTCICDDKHWYIDCPYIRPEARKTGWKADPQVLAQVQNQLDDRDTKERIDRAIENSKRFRSQQKRVSKSDDSEEYSVFTIHRTVNSNESTTSKLYNQWTLDSASNTHVCNDSHRSSYKFTHAATANDFLTAGKQTLPIKEFGEVVITANTPAGNRKIRLANVALVPGFLTNIVSLDRFVDKGVHFDTSYMHLHQNGETFCQIERVNGHYVMEKESILAERQAGDSLAFATERTFSGSIWHQTLAHASPEVISHVPTATTGARLDEKETPAPTTKQCETCAMSKARQQISRQPYREELETEPFQRLSYDLIEAEEAYNGHKWISHFSCYKTNYVLVYTHARKSDAQAVIEAAINLIAIRYEQRVKFFRTDGERTIGNQTLRLFDRFGITMEISAPYTPAQNGHAERSGGVLLTKARAMRIGANLPTSMWPEIIKAAGYICNRTPTAKLNWKTPFEAIHGSQPNISHLRAYGCRSYVLRHDLMNREKFASRAHLGYLVGYDSTNIYRIWIPSMMKVIRSRDVTFNEELFYDPDISDLAEDDAQAQSILDEIEVSEDSITHPSFTQSDYFSPAFDTLFKMYTDQDVIHQSTTPKPSEQSGTVEEPRQLLTPEDSPAPDDGQTDSPTDPPAGAKHNRNANTAPNAEAISAQFAESNILPEGTKRISKKSKRREAYATQLANVERNNGYNLAFAAALSDKQPKKPSLHSSQLPPPPENYRQLIGHKHEEGFRQAMKTEIDSLNELNTWSIVPRSTASKAQKQILPLRWVFKYKLDDKGNLLKYKARICVRGDLQDTDKDTFAATLAARTFRCLMAITAAFDLETRQYDAVNAFVNSEIDEETYCEPPDGFDFPPESVLKLNRALYGLRQSPALWQAHLTSTLESIGLSPVAGVNCLFTNEWITLFFFVDDIAIIYDKTDRDKVDDFEKQLFSTYRMHVLGDLEWFLAIRIVRDRRNRRLWLCQDSYINKLVNRFKLDHDSGTHPHTPIPEEEILPHDEEASSQDIFRYQQLIGSLNYASTITRPDVSFATSKLSEHLRNPSPRHIQLAQRAIRYLAGTKHLSIRFDGLTINPNELFMGWSDASFANDTITRKSHQGILFTLYGGAIDWMSNKQRTVTTSSTEAEFLALSHAGKETIWWKHFFDAVHFDPDHQMSLHCDNQQTMRLLTEPSPQLTTKLRHIDIHQHWLRQEVREERVSLLWTPSAAMIADGLTKPLSRQKFDRFVKQLQLAPVSQCLQRRHCEGGVSENKVVEMLSEPKDL